MRKYRALAVPAATLLSLACATTGMPESGRVAASPPLGEEVHRFVMEDYEAYFCAETSDWTYEVPGGRWIAFPIGWIAKDEPTARANWEYISFRLTVDGEPLDLPGGLTWQTDRVRFQCEDRYVEGVMMAPVVYLPPLSEERAYGIHMVFNETIHDGWADFEKGTDWDGTITLVPMN